MTRWPHLNPLHGAALEPDGGRGGAHPRGGGRARTRRADPGPGRGVGSLLGRAPGPGRPGLGGAEHLADLRIAAEQIERATVQPTSGGRACTGMTRCSLSLPGMGPMTAPTVRAFLGDGPAFATAKAAACLRRDGPSNWSSGTMTQPSRAITKEGRRCCGWRSIKPPAPPAAPTRSWPRTTTT